MTRLSGSDDKRPVVVHVTYRFDVGGLENGVVNLINHMPSGAYRHVVVSLTAITEFRRRIGREDVEFIALDKKPGHVFWIYPELYRLFRRLRPAIVHTRNLAALEAVVPAWAAGIPVRIHGEHGRDVEDFDGTNRKYQRIRRVYSPFVTRYIALSRDLQRYLVDKVGIDSARVVQFYNGVDDRKFRMPSGRQAIADCPFQDPELWLLGTVGRMQIVKDQPTLARAFIRAIEREPQLRSRLRLVMIGDGPLRTQVVAMLEAAGLEKLAWLPGERDDVAEILQGLDLFVLPSLAEGISNTILEAMATGLPVIATNVGGNAELVEPGKTGFLVPSADPESMADKIVTLALDPGKARAAGRAGRDSIERNFSIDSMVQSYQGLYDESLIGVSGTRPGVVQS